MKNLWTTLPPLMSDSSGLIEVIKHTDGCAVVDDSGDFRTGGSRGGGGGHGGGPGGRGGMDWHGGHGGFGGGHGGHGGRGGGGKGGSNTRTVVSGANSQDVTTGTRDAILDAFQGARMRFDPNFVLLSSGPCGAMIGTDLTEIAETITAEYGLPAAAVELTGQKTYDIGISKTIEGMAKLLAEPVEQVTGTINLLGATSLDWAADDLDELKAWTEQQGYRILSAPGTAVTAEQLKQMGSAQINLVTTVSGLAAARYLQDRFGTPFVAGAPFGVKRCTKLADLLNVPCLPEPAEPVEADTLIIGEQFAANALREALEDAGISKGVDIATFYQLDKAYARKGDRKLKGEAGARELLNSGKYRLIAADPLLRPLLRQDCTWLDLPHRAMHSYSEGSSLPLFGSKLDNWLNRAK